MCQSKIEQIKLLRDRFYEIRKSNLYAISEEKVRSGFLNKLLEILGWDLSDITEVVEEKHIQGIARDRLREISSIHVKPDYILCKNGVPRIYLDAKNITEDFVNSKEAAFQIRSYAWSTNLPISLISNFEYFGIYNTTFKPNPNQAPDYKAIFFTIDDLIDNYSLYGPFMEKESVQEYKWPSHLILNEALNNSGNKTLDEDFFELLDNFRLQLGEALLHQMSGNFQKLNYYVQIIINRILFIRILEDLELETKGRLLNCLHSDNFWKKFTIDSVQDYEKKYDGALFSEILPRFNIDNRFFEEFITSITIESPYKFDVIPTNFISEIYDLYLGRELIIESGQLKIVNKPLSPEGAVPTPYYLAESLVRETLDLSELKKEEDLLNISVLDPCVGSGTFLIAALEVFSERLKEIRKSTSLNYEDIKRITTKCLYAIDLDPTAIEVLKMTISLKLLTGRYHIKEPLERILSDLAENFKYGNTIVQNDADIPIAEKNNQIPTDISILFPTMKDRKFDYIVTNPPYIEPKHFKKNWPETWKYLKGKYSFTDKVDISMFFLKRFFELVQPNGRVSVIVQKRFFRTEYGKLMRNYIVNSNGLNRVIDFKSNKLFKHKLTYIAGIFLDFSKVNEFVTYDINSFEVNSTYTNFDECFSTINIERRIKLLNSELENKIWSAEFFAIQNLVASKIKENRLTPLKNIKRINIGVGPQVLDSKFYFLSNAKDIGSEVISAVNRRKELVEVEKDVTRKVYRNEQVPQYIDFEQQGSLIVFPYTESGEFIRKDIMDVQYPKTLEYLKFMDKHSTCARVDDPDAFYRYTRETKLDSYNRPKIFIPMTISSVVAVFKEGDYFGDNSNINTIMDKYDDINYLKGLCCIFNSPIFNDFARCYAGEASGGYHKLNKQFLENVPIPNLSQENIDYFVDIFDKITATRLSLIGAFGSKKEYLGNELNTYIYTCNNYIAQLYDLSDEDLEILRSVVND